MYLYLGYFLVQLYPLIVKIFQLNITVLAIFYSFIVVFIWSFIPFLGYGVAKILHPSSSRPGKYTLLVQGFGIGITEASLFYFELLTDEQSTLAPLVVFLMFFLVAYLPINTVANHHYK